MQYDVKENLHQACAYCNVACIFGIFNNFAGLAGNLTKVCPYGNCFYAIILNSKILVNNLLTKPLNVSAKRLTFSTKSPFDGRPSEVNSPRKASS